MDYKAAAIIDMYKAGMSIDDLAVIFNTTVKKINEVLNENGII